MKQRCDVPENQSYKDYGGRGISYCKEWAEFLPFRAWAMTHGYSKDLFLDRENNNGNYEPSNCRWITPQRSAINRRTTKSRIADIAVMRSLFDFGVTNQVIAGLFGVTLDRFSNIRETEMWRNMDSLFSLVA